MRTSTPSSGRPVVDHAAAGLGHAIGRHDVRWEVGGRRGTAEDDRAEGGGVDPAQRRGDEGHERRAARHHGVGVESGQHGEPRADDQRPGDDGEPADVGERQAGQPVVVLGHAEPVARRPCRCGDGVVGEHDARGAPVDPLVATTSASPGSTGSPTPIAVQQCRLGWLRGVAGRQGRRRRRGPRCRCSPSTNAGPPGRSRATSRAVTPALGRSVSAARWRPRPPAPRRAR